MAYWSKWAKFHQLEKWVEYLSFLCAALEVSRAFLTNTCRVKWVGNYCIGPPAIAAVYSIIRMNE
jgi:hypothetical protein